MTQGMTPAIQIASFVIANDWGRGKAFGRPLKDRKQRLRGS